MGDFRFKEFSVRQDYSAMKVNSDSVLLGAWTTVPSMNEINVLDIGTGTGLIALMIGQRCSKLDIKGNISGVEIDELSIRDAEYNFKNVAFKNVSFNLIRGAVQQMERENAYKERFNLIISNPPYFINSLQSGENSKDRARHTDSLSQGDLIKSVFYMLKPGGIFALILPIAEGELFLNKMEFVSKIRRDRGESSIIMRRYCEVFTTIKKGAKRVLLEFELSNIETPTGKEKYSIEKQKERLILSNNEEYLPEYKTLTKDFYLSF